MADGYKCACGKRVLPGEIDPERAVCPYCGKPIPMEEEDTDYLDGPLEEEETDYLDKPGDVDVEPAEESGALAARPTDRAFRGILLAVILVVLGATIAAIAIYFGV